MERKFTPEEIVRYNGQNGSPVYVAVDGKVYDVSASKLWETGQHMKRHASGRNLTVDLTAAPHGKEVLEREHVKQVGILEGGVEEAHIPAFLSALFNRFPILRRHPHPMMVHFPVAYLIGGAAVLLLDFVAPKAAPFEQMAFALLVLAALFTPLAIGTGLLTWWVNYGGRRVHQIVRKLQVATVLALVEVICLAMRIRGPLEGEVSGGIYFALTLLMACCAVILGWYGGQLTFPYERE